MASVSATNPGMADLLQTLSNIDSPVMSSPAAIAALEKAPPTDIVQLSEAAMQLEGLDAMFGIQDGSNATGSSATNIQDLLNGAVGAAATSPGAAANALVSSTASSTASPADQLANYQLASQETETQTLFDPGTTGGLSNSLLDMIA
jgi:hypothetical protein